MRSSCSKSVLSLVNIEGARLVYQAAHRYVLQGEVMKFAASLVGWVLSVENS